MFHRDFRKQREILFEKEKKTIEHRMHTNKSNLHMSMNHFYSDEFLEFVLRFVREMIIVKDEECEEFYEKKFEEEKVNFLFTVHSKQYLSFQYRLFAGNVEGHLL